MQIDRIQFKRSILPGYIPSPGTMGEGELFINLPDKKLFTKNEYEELIPIGGGGSSDIDETPFVKGDLEWTNVKGQKEFAIRYTVGDIEVFLNGIELSITDYEAVDGKTVTLGFEVENDDDVVRIKSYRGGQDVSDYLSGTPVGTIAQFLKDKVPEGQLVCDGSNYSKEEFPSLFEYLGTETLPNLMDSQVGDIMPWMSDSDIPDGWHHLGAQNEEEIANNKTTPEYAPTLVHGRSYKYSEYPEFCDFINASRGNPLGTDAVLHVIRNGEAFRQKIKINAHSITGSGPDQDVTNIWQYQGDAIRPVTGSFGYLTGASQHHAPYDPYVTGVFKKDGDANNAHQWFAPSAVLPNIKGSPKVSFDISRVHPVAKDVRMVNRSVNYLIKVKPTATTSQTVFCIKAAGKLNKEGLMQVTKLKEKITKLETKVVNLEDSLSKVPNPNLFINGDMSVCQRSSKIEDVPASGMNFTVDRWFAFKNAGGVLKYGQDSIGDGESGPFVKSVRFSTSDSARFTWAQRVELYHTGLNVFGKTFTVSGIGRSYLSVDQPALKGRIIKVHLAVVNSDGDVKYSQNFDTDISLGYPAQGFSYTFNIPEKSYEQILVPQFLQVAFEIELEKGHIDLSCMKLEFGSVATPFIPDDPATNLAKCQRYYVSAEYGKNTGLTSGRGHGVAQNVNWLFAPTGYVCRRPNILRFSATNGDDRKISRWNDATVVTVNSGAVNENGVIAFFQSNGFTAGESYAFNYAIDAEL